jgi:hypothetical protein
VKSIEWLYHCFCDFKIGEVTLGVSRSNKVVGLTSLVFVKRKLTESVLLLPFIETCETCDQRLHGGTVLVLLLDHDWTTASVFFAVL